MKAEIIILLLFILSLVLIWPAYTLARNTFIPVRYLLLTPLIGMGVALLSMYKTSPYHLAWTIFLAITVGGCLSVFSLLMVNKHFPRKAATWETFDVKGNGASYGLRSRYQSNCEMPFVQICIRDRCKLLELTCDDLQTVELFSKVECNYLVGAFGWPYIIDYIAKK